MRTAAVVFSYLACASCARRVQTAERPPGKWSAGKQDKMQADWNSYRHVKQSAGRMEALSNLLLMSNPPAAWSRGTFSSVGSATHKTSARVLPIMLDKSRIMSNAAERFYEQDMAERAAKKKKEEDEVRNQEQLELLAKELPKADALIDEVDKQLEDILPTGRYYSDIQPGEQADSQGALGLFLKYFPPLLFTASVITFIASSKGYLTFLDAPQ
mmetsp:Transcript_123028/g.229923  ORF Transcript_123028/g.229923 Transcript_123028/m.229923 type:complete len:214 (-) Transcript_123028:153-794(-)